MPAAPTLPSPFVRAVSEASPAGRAALDAAPVAVPRDTLRWCTLAVSSLVGAGLLSLAIVVGRLPFLSRVIDDPLFFKRCLVVHVDLALIVWFYAFLAGLLALVREDRGARPSAGSPAGSRFVPSLAFALAAGGVVAMLAGALVRGAEPVLANYVPVIDHPLFYGGLAAFFTGALFYFVAALGGRAKPAGRAMPDDACVGLQAAAVAIVIAAATWASARAGLPDGLDTYTRAEFLAWGPGHVLQAANAAAMLAVWLWLLERATGAPALSRRAAQLVFGLLVLPQAVMPLLTVRGTLDSLYHTGATQLMRWAIFPAILVVFALGVAHLRLHRRRGPAAPEASAALTGFAASAALALTGLVLGACIRGSTTLVPAHYHASLGAVTMAFMTAAYFVADLVRRGRTHAPLPTRTWRAARWQLGLFGVGQTVFALGFALGGIYGLGRKTYAAEQHVRSAGEFTGLIVMGAGGLVAVAGGLWFLFLLLREIRGWWRRPRAAAPSSSLSQPATS